VAEHRADTHDALLDVAERLFGEKGYAAVGIREIAEQAGANIAAIKYHFGSKSDLYLQTVRRAMARREAVGVWDVLREKPADLQEGATVLARFIHLFLSHLLPTDGVDTCGNLLLREALEPTEAIEAVVADYMRPHQSMLIGVLEIMLPDAGRRELAMVAHSILGQILHYRVSRPFVERLGVGAAGKPEGVARIARHIARFSLRAVGCSRKVIERALAEAQTLDMSVSCDRRSSS